MPAQFSFALRRATLATALATAMTYAYSQTVTPPTALSDPHEALAFFEGTWTTSDALPGDEFRETCAWLAEGRRHMVCRSRWRTAAGYREGLSIFSYNQTSGEYQYHGFRPSGAVVTQKGQRLPKGWLFTSARGAGDDRVQTRVTIEKTTEGRFSFVSETAKGGNAWQAAPKFEYIQIGK